jgi:hypothetical protein
MRAPYVSSASEPADPVGEIVFTFFNDALYQVVVNYHRDRTAGLTNSDIIDTLTAAYGAPVLRSARTQAARHRSIPWCSRSGRPPRGH